MSTIPKEFWLHSDTFKEYVLTGKVTSKSINQDKIEFDKLLLTKKEEERKIMQQHNALFIKVLRLDLNCSFKRISELWKKVYPEALDNIDDDIENGSQLCLYAAETLGEVDMEWWI